MDRKRNQGREKQSTHGQSAHGHRIAEKNRAHKVTEWQRRTEHTWKGARQHAEEQGTSAQEGRPFLDQDAETTGQRPGSGKDNLEGERGEGAEGSIVRWSMSMR